MRWSIDSLLSISAFIPVFNMPVPRGFVITSTSSGNAPSFLRIFFGCTMPVTDSPYLISSSSTLWPPSRLAPASLILSTPPLMISFKMAISNLFVAKQTMFKAVFGTAPMA